LSRDLKLILTPENRVAKAVEKQPELNACGQWGA